MKFKDWIQETTITTRVSTWEADSVSSNKLLRIKISDDIISDLINKLDNYKVEKRGDVVTLDLPYDIDKKTMNILSKYTI